MIKYLVPKIGCNKYGESNILAATFKRMKDDATAPINKCENYLLYKGQTVVYVNGILLQTKDRIHYEYLVYESIDEAIEKYIELREREKKEYIDEQTKKINIAFDEEIKRIKEMKRLTF